MRIASVEIPGRIFLAPLAAYTSWPFRRICRRFGAALVTTEVIKARDLLRGIPATLQVLDFKPDEHPIAGQLLAADPAEAGEGAARLGEMGFDIVDLNCGCPKRRVLSDGMGGALMASPELVEKIVAQMVRRAKTPVTVKMRAGRFKDRPTAVEMARRCEAAGAAAICVHPRPAEGGATAPPDWSHHRRGQARRLDPGHRQRRHPHARRRGAHVPRDRLRRRRGRAGRDRAPLDFPPGRRLARRRARNACRPRRRRFEPLCSTTIAAWWSTRASGAARSPCASNRATTPNISRAERRSTSPSSRRRRRRSSWTRWRNTSRTPISD